MHFAAVLFSIILLLVPAAPGVAQEQVWVQIEAQPTLREGEERARAYSGVFPNVGGFAMTTGWYAIVLGPYSLTEAERQLFVLKGERLIPADSYIAFGNRFARQFWPVAGAPAAVAPAAPTVPETTLPTVALSDETPAEARRSEALLTAEERGALQSALQWDGFYVGAIDGAFGPGTRRSMALWQNAKGYEETGILTSAQRTELLDHYRAEQAALGLQLLTDDTAGIEIPYPSALVEFDRYEPPFAHFREKDGSGFRMLLISQRGNQTTLAGLFDLMQSLEIVPVSGERTLIRDGFTLHGANDRIASHTEVRQSGDLIRGFTLIWNPADGDQAGRVLEAMTAGFRPFGDTALDEGLDASLAVARDDLVSGLKVRRPLMSHSGFWLDAAGLVATEATAVEDCDRVTVAGDHTADIVLSDDATGLVVLKPQDRLAPRAHAQLAAMAPAVGAEIAVAGFPYGDALDTAVMTFGTLADTKGLGGEPDRARLSVTTREGDTGAAVLDGTGRVVAMLLPRDGSGGQVLPDDVAFAVAAPALAEALAGAGLMPAGEAVAEAGGTLAPEDLTLRGRDLATLVSCWR